MKSTFLLEKLRCR